MIKMNMKLGNKGYPIYVALDFSKLSKVWPNTQRNEKIMVITDSNVKNIYCDECIEELSKTGAQVFQYVIPAGEKSKNLNTVANIYRELISHKFDRNSALAALGGGVVGDITGFVAATYMRGIPFAQIPTSLLAQADSSIGGKTGVDFEGSKNMVGAFYQPCFVYINVNTLRTLPKRELISGLAEVIKHGLIQDSDFYEYINYNINKIFSFDEQVLQYISKMNLSIKGNVVSQDETEKGIRAILNFGHTIGHAIESVSDFSLLHGECVSLGMAGAFRLALKLGMIQSKTVADVENTLSKAGLPVRVKDMDTDGIYNQMLFDKKAQNGKLRFILPKGIGHVIQYTLDNEQMIKEVIRELTE